MTVIMIPGVPDTVQQIIQERTLDRVLNDALMSSLLFRMDATPELWNGNLGDELYISKAGLMEVDLTPIVPGKDPSIGNYSTEQWRVVASQYGKTIPTFMPNSNMAVVQTYLRDVQALGEQAGRTLNRLTRNKLYSAYLAGEASITATAAIGAQQIQVSTLNGFTENVSNGRIAPVGLNNAVAISFSTAEPDNAVVSAVPNDPAQPLGPGTLQLQNALTAGLAARDVVLAANRSVRVRVGGGTSVDAITGTDILTLQSVMSGVARLRAMNVKPHSDGTYHVHLTPTGEAQLFQDPLWQNLNQDLNTSSEFKQFMIKMAVGCTFIRNNELPSPTTVSSSLAVAGGAGGATVAPEIGAELTTAAGLPIGRTIITGQGTIMEKYIDESAYITMAGVTGKVGNFTVNNNGAQVMTDRIRYVLRAPLDPLQQNVTHSWSWSGDFGVPSDLLTGDPSRFKRAVVIEHA